MKINATLALAILLGTSFSGFAADPPPPRNLYAEIYAINCAFDNNRLGAFQPYGKIYALARDTVTAKDKTVCLRNGKRPRPLVLRMNVGDTLTVDFTNQLTIADGDPSAKEASIHASGVGLKEIASDGSWVGVNPSSQAAKGQTVRYRWTAQAEGVFLMYSQACDALGDATSAGQLADGLFGAIVVEPPGAQYYRSQVTADDLARISKGGKIDYAAEYEEGCAYAGAGNGVIPPGTPILNMLKTGNQDNVNPDTGKPYDFEFVHTDLTALITGPEAGDFPKDSTGPSFEPNPAYPERWKAWREFTIFYHDDFTNTQAWSPTVSADGYKLSGYPLTQSDNFAINYGIAGIVPTIYANRIKSGPQGQAVTAKFEEFFLSSWACGDPAMPVNSPVNTASKANPTTYAKFPDDPSNVYHSYMNDHVKFRILHAGSNLTHVHHLHAHQWLRSAASDESSYLDSQTISPGASDTLDICYGGSGNKNKTVGDSIFHCHFYPHFAGGMWALWRVHDVFEEGTPLLKGKDWPMIDTKANGGWVRALPDGEIATGTPIPAVVPVPTIAMAPKPAKVKLVPAEAPKAGDPGAKPMPVVGQVAQVDDADLDKHLNPGFPFYIPGVGGQRAPHPPLDFAVQENGKAIDGGLPRHLILNADNIYEQHSHADFTKEVGTYTPGAEEEDEPKNFVSGKVTAVKLPEGGTRAEWVAMLAHATRDHVTLLPNGGTPGPGQRFVLNGKPPVAGAPFAEPYIDSNGDVPKPPLPVRRYKAADIQLDVVFNKKGWHYPQQRIIALWDDVKPTLKNERAPEPFFFRANSGECVEFWHTNLVPAYYEWDNFQIRTPTDIIGQHIHLVKFDVTASDGSANGFNYEDGTFSPEEVRHLIKDIEHGGGLYKPEGSNYAVWKEGTPSTYQWPVPSNAWMGMPREKLEAVPHPVLGDGADVGQNWKGAQTTVQRWYADPVLDNAGKDRTLRTVFTHDHFGPTTHQQAGLYAGLLVEPAGSTWKSNTDANVQLGNDPKRTDGGPTSWQARIVDEKDAAKSYREFALEFGDTQLTYLSGSKKASDEYVAYPSGSSGSTKPPKGYRGWLGDRGTPGAAVNTPEDNGQFVPIYSQAFQQGSFVVNYRNEPIPVRVNYWLNGVDNPAEPEKDSRFSLANAYASIPRFDPQLNVQPAKGSKIFATDMNNFVYPAPFAGAGNYDPYTPLLRAYQGDNVQVRTLVGSQIAPHSFTIDGLSWLYEPGYAESGYINAQTMGISEHFEMLFKLPFLAAGAADYLYRPSSGLDGFQNGMWGLLRSYPNGSETSLPSLQDTKGTPLAISEPTDKPFKTFRVYALLLPANPASTQPMVVYMNEDDLEFTPPLTPAPQPLVVKKVKLKHPNIPIEPLILRCNAGDVVKVQLINAIVNDDTLQGGLTAIPAQINPIPWQGIPTLTQGDPANPTCLVTQPFFARTVGLDVQMLARDPVTGTGTNVGANNVAGGKLQDQLVAPPTVAAGGYQLSSRDYLYYAGKIDPITGERTPVEFGAVDILPADNYVQQSLGLIGALIVEPPGTTFRRDYQPQANPKDPKDPSKDGIYYTRASGTVMDASGQPLFREFVAVFDDANAVVRGTSINYATAPLGPRVNPNPPPAPDLPLEANSAEVVSDYQLSQPADPPTPVFAAAKGSPVRLRLLHPGGSGNDMTILLHGHAWQEEPWRDGSTKLGINAKSNWQGAHDRFGPNNAFNLVLGPGGAGGVNGVTGDFLFRNFLVGSYQNGGWGLLRVGDPAKSKGGPDVVSIINYPGAPGSSVPAPPSVPFTVSGRNTVNLLSGALGTSITASSSEAWFSQISAPVGTDGTWQFTMTAKALPVTVTVTSSEGGSSSVTILAPSPMTAPTPKMMSRVLATETTPVRTQSVSQKSPVTSNGMMRQSPPVPLSKK